MASLLPSMTNLKRQVVGGIDLAICCVLVNFLPSELPSVLPPTRVLMSSNAVAKPQLLLLKEPSFP